MKHLTTMMAGRLVLLMVLMMSILLPVNAAPRTTSSKDDTPQKTAEFLNIADIIPGSTALAIRFLRFEKEIARLPVSDIQSTDIDTVLARIEAEIKYAKINKNTSFSRLMETRQSINEQKRQFELTHTPLDTAVDDLARWRTEWMAEKTVWENWRSLAADETQLDVLMALIDTANETVNRAVSIVHEHLAIMLAAQQQVGAGRVKISVMEYKITTLIDQKRQTALLKASPPMFTLQYLSQFGKGELRYAVQQGVSDIHWPDRYFFSKHGWIITLQAIVSIFLMAVVIRNRATIKASSRWRFLAARPWAFGLFSGFMITQMIYEYQSAPASWSLITRIIGAVSFIRLVGSLVETDWIKRSLFGMILVLLVTKFLDLMNCPLPIFRLYILLASLTGLVFCLHWSRKTLQDDFPDYTRWIFHISAACLTIIAIAEVWGKEAIGLYLFLALIRTLSTTLVFLLFIYILHGGLEWVFQTAFFKRLKFFKKDHPQKISTHIQQFIDAVIILMVLLPGMLVIWDISNDLGAAAKLLLTSGFSIGSLRISLGLLVVTAGILYLSFLISWIIQELLINEFILKRQIKRGVRLSIARLLHYAILITGFIIALSALGFEVTKLTIMISALGVGIGFGLQSIVNNFISGLILLFEQPVSVGDSIELAGTWSEIKSIGLRSTIVQTADNADVIIPNSDLITNQVTNWTLRNRYVRIRIPVGVAYGSDVPLVMKTLIDCAGANTNVAKFFPPQVLFLNFGDSSLDFELRVWALDADYRLQVQSELHQEIDQRFREASIEIAFPQRDLHVRSMDESVGLER